MNANFFSTTLSALAVILSGCTVPNGYSSSPIQMEKGSAVDLRTQYDAADLIQRSMHSMDCQQTDIIRPATIEKSPDFKAGAGYLIAGQLKERWVAQGCNIKISYIVDFSANKQNEGGTDVYIHQEPDQNVLNTITQLKISLAKKRLARLVTADSSFFNGKTTQSKTEIDFSPYSSDGFFYVKTTNSDASKLLYFSQSNEFLGLIQLSSQTQFPRALSSELREDFAFSGDWIHMEPGTELTYTVTMNTIMTDMPGSSSRYVTRCKIIDQISAAVLHPNLSGLAKRLECRIDNDKYKHVDTWYFFEDYAYALRIEGSDNSGYYFSRKITEVAQR